MFGRSTAVACEPANTAAVQTIDVISMESNRMGYSMGILRTGSLLLLSVWVTPLGAENFGFAAEPPKSLRSR